MQLRIPIMEVIKDRHSVRNYQEIALTSEMIHKIKLYIEKLCTPYKGKIRIELICNDNADKKVKLGTYGVIKGAKYFLVAAIANEEENSVLLGYTLEKIVLYCTSLGLGTVWLGGTYNKSQFAEAINLKEDEQIKIVVPVGKEADKKTLLSKVMGSQSKKRKDFSELFFDGGIKNPLTKEAAGVYEMALEMVRLAPSAINKQPWRVIMQGDLLHFYMVDNKNFHEIDLGIGLAHFDLTVKEQNMDGEYIHEDPKIECPFQYLVTWMPK